MIPNNVTLAVVDNHLGGKQFSMTIDLASMPHLMDLLTNMYSDTEMACIREYSTNALDSHMDAGQTRPIEVTTPTSLYPFLKIKDFGLGLSEVDIEELYSQYGKSTKREQTNTNGSMGIGGKSALAYTNQFSLIGIKDGVKIHVSIARESDGTGVMEVVDESLTDEANGVEIIIPAKKDNDFDEKAKGLFRFWTPGTVLLNGAEPKREFTKITDRIYTMPREVKKSSSYYTQTVDYIVMGNVPYPVKGGLDRGDIYESNDRESIVAFVTMNGPDEVVFVPSREELNYVPQTEKVVNGLREEYRAAVTKMIQDTFTSVKSFSEAFTLFRQYSRKYDRGLLKSLVFKGKQMPTGYITDDKRPSGSAGYGRAETRMVWRPNSSRHSVDGRATLTYERVMDGLVITNYPNTSGVSATHKAKIREYRSQQNGMGGDVIFLEDIKVPGAPWTDDATVVDWSIVRAIKLTPQSGNYYTAWNSGNSCGGGYNVYNPATRGYDVRHDLKGTDEIVYFSDAKAADITLGLSQRALILTHLTTYKLVEAAENRHGKLKRLFPKALTPSEALNKIAEIVCASLTTEDRERLLFDKVSGLDYLDKIKYTEVDDPFLQRALKAQEGVQSDRLSALKNLRYSTKVREVEKTIGEPEVADITKRYPLLSYGGYRQPDIYKDNLLYINAKYATLTPKGI